MKGLPDYNANYEAMFCGVECTKEEYAKLSSSFSGLASDEFDQQDVKKALAVIRNGNKLVEPQVADSVAATLAQRGSRYGDFTDHARVCQNLMDVMHKAVTKDRLGETVGSWVKLDPVKKQALTVIADKIARILTGDPNYDDNWHDIQGYAKLVEDRLPKESK